MMKKPLKGASSDRPDARLPEQNRDRSVRSNTLGRPGKPSASTTPCLKRSFVKLKRIGERGERKM